MVAARITDDLLAERILFWSREMQPLMLLKEAIAG
jgi:hypothetical protein